MLSGRGLASATVAIDPGEANMPLIEVNVFEDELTPDQTKDLIRKLTEAVTTVVSPRIRDVVWVVVHEIKSGNWGAGGKPMGVEDIRKMISG
jgi:4-oxalocrotonate tautomerase